MEGGTLAPQVASTDLTRLVRETVESMGPQAASAGVAIGLTAPAEGLVVPVDPERIARVVTNLVANAVKFTPAGGRVQLSLGGDAQGVVVEVADTGPGVDPADVPKLFRPFSQLEGGQLKQQGVGLGLWIGKALVEAHGGTIGVRGGTGGGAVFWFRLPR
jgi:signal transduction histidine kinase